MPDSKTRTTVKKDENAEPKMDGKDKQRMQDILAEMKQKMKELDKLKAELEMQKYDKISPEKSKSMLEEITVPSIEVFDMKKKPTASAN